jgi:hypothetical protein
LPNTPVFAWPYHGLSDPPNGASLGQALALAAESTVSAIDARVLALEAALPYRARQITGGVVASVTFSSIPTSLRSIVIKCTTRFNANGAADLWMRINGNSSAANYYSQVGGANITAMITPIDNPASITALQVGVVAGNNNAGEYGVTEIVIDGWDQPHSSHLGFVSLSGAIVAGVSSLSRWCVGKYTPAGPYTSITLLPSGGSFDTGCEFNLIGDRV